MIVSYPVSGTADGECTTDSLRSEVRASAFASSESNVIGVTFDATRTAGEEIEIEYAIAPTGSEATAIDAAIAAHNGSVSTEDPSLAFAVPITTEVLTMTSGVSQVLCELAIAEGDYWVFDVHVHCAEGDPAGSTRSSYLDWYIDVHRTVGGSVVAAKPEEADTGKIPGLEIEAVETATSVIFKLKTRKSCTLKLFPGTAVHVKEYGKWI